MRDRRLLLSFDVDCGEQLPGHTFLARGLSDDGRGSGPNGDEPTVQRFSLQYELVPGISSDHQGDFFRYLVGIEYWADVALPWDPSDGGATAPFEGGVSTHGSRGSWPLPPEAKLLTFDLYPMLPDEQWRSEQSSGQLTVHLATGDARWRPA